MCVSIEVYVFINVYTILDKEENRRAESLTVIIILCS